MLEFGTGPGHGFEKMETKMSFCHGEQPPENVRNPLFLHFPSRGVSKIDWICNFLSTSRAKYSNPRWPGAWPGGCPGLAGAGGLAKMRSWDVPGLCRNWCRAGMGLPQAYPGAGSGLSRMGGWRGSLAKADWVQSAFRQPNPWSQSIHQARLPAN